MKFDSVFLLPLLAVVLIVFYRVFKNHPKHSKSIKSRKHRKILLGRFAVFVLLLTTAISYLVTFEGMSKLATASILSGIVLIPAYLAHLYMTRRYASIRKADTEVIVADVDSPTDKQDGSGQSEPVLIADEQTSASVEEQSEKANQHTSQKFPEQMEQVEQVGQVASTIPDTEDLPAINLTNESYSTSTTTMSQSAAPSLLLRERPPGDDHSVTAEGEDSPAEVQEQLDRVSDHIESHDLGNSDYSLSDDDLEQRRFSLKSDVPLAIESALATVDMSANELSKMSSNEISELVTTLRTDKTKLQKLVIAQQASLDSERKAHDQSRTVARDAIKIMRDARNGQKYAEKLARRERSERKKVEQQYKKVANALNNAMSIIEARKAEDAEA